MLQSSLLSPASSRSAVSDACGEPLVCSERHSRSASDTSDRPSANRQEWEIKRSSPEALLELNPFNILYIMLPVCDSPSSLSFRSDTEAT